MNISKLIQDSWLQIAPAWPVHQFVASNPLMKLQSKHFEKAIQESYKDIQQASLPRELLQVNHETIIWLEVFFDTGQATLTMPYRELGLYRSCKKMFLLDCKQKRMSAKIINFLQQLPDDPEQACSMLLDALQINQDQAVEFVKKVITSLPGWASYIVYYVDWVDTQTYPVTKLDYTVVRLMLLYIFWPNSSNILSDLFDTKDTHEVQELVQSLVLSEEKYQSQLLSKFSLVQEKVVKYDAQFIVCIDPRSERLRRHLEQQGSYETFGFAGFFGLPIQVHNDLKQKQYDACPVLLKSVHNIKEVMICNTEYCQKLVEKKVSFKNVIKNLYKALKYTFVAPFALVEILGLYTVCWMFLRLFVPCYAANVKERFTKTTVLKPIMWPEVDSRDESYGLTWSQQCDYALQALRMIGLVDNFASIVVVTSHIAQTDNNSYATALNCGACGSNSGLVNAKLLATILNNKQVRDYLKKHNIIIPKETYVIAAEHNTTTDEVMLYDNQNFLEINKDILEKLRKDLKIVQHKVLQERSEALQKKSVHSMLKRSCDWSQVRPEWGLAKNASMIIGPRQFSQSINLEGRSFLHSYDWQLDPDMSLLRTIMTAPMVVAHWINMQYLFSTLNNVIYGSGSKVTHNLTGKFGIMQGNTSDLMTGLSLQSIASSDTQLYHDPVRLTVVIYAPVKYVIDVVASEEQIKELVVNEWLHVYCYEPDKKQMVCINQDMLG
tara:strand:+ start:3120 stop:5282 length:2163 start_codon:yes stop_codon:yes gene_type:complete